MDEDTDNTASNSRYWRLALSSSAWSKISNRKEKEPKPKRQRMMESKSHHLASGGFRNNIDNENDPTMVARLNASRRYSDRNIPLDTSKQVKPGSAKTISIQKLRVLTRNLLQQQQYSNAIFYADKLVSMSRGNHEDVYILGQAMFGLRQYKRAFHLIKRFNLLDPMDPNNIQYIQFGAHCLVNNKQWEECSTLLQDTFFKICSTNFEDDDGESMKAQAVLYAHNIGEEINVIATMCVLLGKAYEGLGNRKFAIKWYIYALQCDVYCYEAMGLLISNSMLTEGEENDLLKKLQFENPTDSDWLYLLYKGSMNVYNVEDSVESRFGKLESEWDLADNFSLMENKARVLYYQNDVSAAYQLTKKIREQDLYDYNCLPIHIASMVQLKMVTDLHFCAHKLVADYPNNPVSWFAVGSYYMLTNNYPKARRYFNKSKSLDNNFTPAWIGIGNAFAAQDESDQAMATYRSASRLLVGCHVPLVSMGMEYMRTNNFDLAHQQFIQAMEVCKTDPLLFNEIGVWAYKGQNYDLAMVYLKQALSLCSMKSRKQNDTCEVIYVNLAHTNRKLGDYDSAIRYFENAISLSPHSASTYAGLGFTYHLKGELNKAISFYHQALGLKPEDTFAEEMLKKALNEMFAAPLEISEKVVDDSMDLDL